MARHSIRPKQTPPVETDPPAATEPPAESYSRAEPGDYLFRCDVHPTQMSGTFVVRG